MVECVADNAWGTLLNAFIIPELTNEEYVAKGAVCLQLFHLDSMPPYPRYRRHTIVPFTTWPKLVDAKGPVEGKVEPHSSRSLARVLSFDCAGVAS